MLNKPWPYSLILALSLSGCVVAITPQNPNPAASPTVAPSSPTPGASVSPSPAASVDPNPTGLGFHLVPSRYVQPNLPLSVSSKGVTMSFEKVAYKTNSSIRLTYTASGTVADNAWIGIVPSTVAHGEEFVNDQNKVDFQFLNGKNSGVLEFSAPGIEKGFDFRYNDNDGNGKELASLSFVSTRELPPEEMAAVAISLSPGPYRAGQDVTLNYKAPATFMRDAWIGILSADKPHGEELANDQNNIDFQFIENKTSGSMTFKLPSTPGRYDFRMHDRDNLGKEACYYVIDVLP